jgi:hypothetical protein
VRKGSRGGTPSVEANDPVEHCFCAGEKGRCNWKLECCTLPVCTEMSCSSLFEWKLRRASLQLRIVILGSNFVNLVRHKDVGPFMAILMDHDLKGPGRMYCEFSDGIVSSQDLFPSH